MAGYKRIGRFLVLAGACWLWTGLAPAQDGGGRPLAEIVKDLGSTEFAVRERAQGELAKVPREQFNALREAKKGTQDAEVKARLRVRIGELAREPLLQAPRLSVDVKDATLVEVAEALNEEMGLSFIQFAPGAATLRVTLKSQDQFLWDILRQVHEQKPMSVSNGKLVTPPARPINLIKLELPTEGLPPRPVRPICVVDGVCTTPYILPAEYSDGNLAVGCMIYTDPRVQLMRYARTLRVEKAIDQDGRAMVEVPPESKGMGLPQGAVSKIECRATFAQDPQVKVIRELRGKAIVEVLESEDVATIDLTNAQHEPLATAWGRFTLETAANGGFTLRLAPAAAAPGTAGRAPEPATAAGAPMPVVRLIYDTGDTTQLIAAGSRSWNITRRMGTSLGPRTAAMLEIVLSQKTREVALPVVIRDLDVAANTPPVVKTR
jgi:hypothetical protein